MLNRTYFVRSDLSATLFFSSPEEYDGGELVIEDTYGIHSVKLPVGYMVLYPSSSLHHVRPVTRGARTLLFDLDNVAQRIAAEQIDSPNAIRLTGIYHNLLRRWAERSGTTSSRLSYCQSPCLLTAFQPLGDRQVHRIHGSQQVCT